MRALLVALCACNQVYDLNATRPRDAAEVDVLPTTCPVRPPGPASAC